MTTQVLAPTSCIVRDTASRKGRTQAVTPGTTAASRYLRYGRIILDAGDAPERFATNDHEYGVVNVQPEFAATPSGLDAARGEKA